MPSIAGTLVFFKNNLWIFLWHVWPSPVWDPGQQWLLTSSESITAREWRLLPPSEFLSGTPKLRFLELELLAQSPLTFSVGPQGQAFLQRPESPVRVQGVSSSVHNNSNSKSRLRTDSRASPSDALLLLFSVQGSSHILFQRPCCIICTRALVGTTLIQIYESTWNQTSGRKGGGEGQGLKYLSLPLRSLGSWWKWFPSETGIKRNPSFYLSSGYHSCPPRTQKAQWTTTISTGTRREW